MGAIGGTQLGKYGDEGVDSTQRLCLGRVAAGLKAPVLGDLSMDLVERDGGHGWLFVGEAAR